MTGYDLVGAGDDTLGREFDSSDNTKGPHGAASPAIALGDALGEESVASPRVGAPGLAGGRSDGDG